MPRRVNIQMVEDRPCRIVGNNDFRPLRRTGRRRDKDYRDYRATRGFERSIKNAPMIYDDPLISMAKELWHGALPDNAFRCGKYVFLKKKEKQLARFLIIDGVLHRKQN